MFSTSFQKRKIKHYEYIKRQVFVSFFHIFFIHNFILLYLCVLLYDIILRLLVFRMYIMRTPLSYVMCALF